MNTRAADNPFHVLGLPTIASDEDVARQYNRLCKARPDEQPGFRRAWEELRSNPVTRRAHELLEMPDTDYREREDGWRSFERKNRRNPVDLAALAAESPGAPAVDMPALISAALDALLDIPAADLPGQAGLAGDAGLGGLAVHGARLPGDAALPVGLADLIFG